MATLQYCIKIPERGGVVETSSCSELAHLSLSRIRSRVAS